MRQPSDPRESEELDLFFLSRHHFPPSSKITPEFVELSGHPFARDEFATEYTIRSFEGS